MPSITCWCVVFAALLSSVSVSSFALADSQPLLIVSKTISNDFVVVGDTVEFTVTVYNYGQSPAHDVTVTDLLADGTVRTKEVGMLSYGESAELKYTLTLKDLGNYPVGVSEVTYALEKGGEKVGRAYSNVVREGTAYYYGEHYDDESFRGVVSVLTRERYDRLYKRYVRESIAYAFLCVIPALFPFVVYRMEQNQMDLLIRRSKASK
ncbi:putative Translocon associated protein beta (TRAPB) CARDB Domain of unknown function DUF11 [Trypanosoma vivax]|uniref:DUF11 domain-containing protein n=1 Tax=Trypanosoma vivax (strain Y486) TaxID=1055687 RepID=G0TXA8_TRYVY|nr:hypothetical protein TRVL_05444 [Trypanosoma vivax]KAH8613946.1 putative Translocon associated protein beta (TRAPB) CARDB Domain of unknown function DUF11 [Trypanosoma vivax]CCC48598.1 conserved hypothetical protein [Trypanosoma vivax Y486]